MDYGWVVALSVWGYGGFVDGRACRAQDADREIWRTMGHDAHGYEDHQKIQEDGKVGDKAVVLQSADLGHKEPGDDEQQGTDDVAEAEFGDFAYILPKLNGHLAEEEEQAQGL